MREIDGKVESKAVVSEIRLGPSQIQTIESMVSAVAATTRA